MTAKKASRSKSAKSAARATIGIIGGSGLYAMGGLSEAREIRVKTPFGEPSDGIVLGTLEGKRVAFLARHGRGVERIISVSAVGSLKEDLRPGEFLVPDQFFDRTKNRISTFFGEGIVAHVAFAHPTCNQLSSVLADACVHEAVMVHRRGTYICIEGPQFSTLAEAEVHRQLRFEVIGMTNVTEARLAREAEICYATIAMITDYDCWHPAHESVTASQIIATLNQNAENAQKVLQTAVRELPAARSCKCGSALQHALVTDLKIVPKATKKRLAAIIGKYIS
ncbi:MAG: S-methyl-5'-thioadenosine phosphorylase [Acidobacteria bacterium]|nr:MAG: S-methyl-5'-thioadenosine phosphorylase [Acidobacteriota bacterium]